MSEPTVEADREQCPVCLQDGVVVTAGSSWRKCRNCEASWNSRYTVSPLGGSA